MGWWLNVKAGSEVSEKGHVPFCVYQTEYFVVVVFAARWQKEIQAPVQAKCDILKNMAYNITIMKAQIWVALRII